MNVFGINKGGKDMPGGKTRTSPLLILIAVLLCLFSGATLTRSSAGPSSGGQKLPDMFVPEPTIIRILHLIQEQNSRRIPRFPPYPPQILQSQLLPRFHHLHPYQMLLRKPPKESGQQKAAAGSFWWTVFPTQDGSVILMGKNTSLMKKELCRPDGWI